MSESKTVDAKTPRLKAAFHALIPALAFLLQGSLGVALVGAVAAAMALSVIGGPRLSLLGQIVTRVVRPALKIAPGNREDAVPHVFAEAVGAVFLTAAFVALLSGLSTVGWGLTLIVVALAALNWLAGICVGCQMYLLFRRVGTRKKVTA